MHNAVHIFIQIKPFFNTLFHLCMFQVGPGIVFLQFEHSFLGRGVIIQSVTPVEPLLQCVSHKIFYQSNIPALVPKFILKAECIQVQYVPLAYRYKHSSIV